MHKNPSRRSQSIDGFVPNRPQSTSRLSARRIPHIAPKPSVVQPLRRSQPSSSLKSAVSRTTPRSYIDTLHSETVSNSKHHGRPGRKAIATVDNSPLLLHSKRTRRQRKATKPPKARWRIVTKRIVLACLAFLLLSGGWVGWKIYRNTAKIFGNKNPLAVLSVFKPIPLKGQATGHVNILLAGDSADRTDNSGGGDLTDSIMIFSLNTKTHAAYMISIPRDLWVNIPGYGYSKINAANTATKFSASGYPAGGMGMLEKVISDNLDIDINYYALVNYTAFRDAVNEVGGINVTIQSPDPRGLYDPSFRPAEGGPLKLPNGVSHLDGQTALNLARARGDPYNGVWGAYGFPQSDFDRTQHQRQMMLALKDKAISMSVLSNPLKIGGLMDAVGNNVKTDFQINELASLYSLMKGVNNSNIQSIGLNNVNGQNLLANYSASGGQSALIPASGIDDFSAIQTYINKTINATPVTTEAAKVVILNGGQTAGLGQTYATLLNQKGSSVTTVANAPATYQKTTIIDNSGGKKPATKDMLSATFSKNFSTDATLSKQYPGDFIIILGVNQQAPSATDMQSNSASSNSNSSTSNI